MRVTFLSLEDEEWAQLMRAAAGRLPAPFTGGVHVGRVEEYTAAAPARHTYYVSPANSFGFMDGGIDLAYSRVMFPGVEPRVKEAIRALGWTTKLRRPYLPIGRALVVPATGAASLVVAPTMLLPQAVPETRNAFHAMAGVLQCVWGLRGDDSAELVVPPLCCGYGRMRPADSAAQIVEAFAAAATRGALVQQPIEVDAILREQPKYYANTEWI
jgi:O-acetyl-ADP-ribose deacetylase (regulator of RNase III)